MPIDTDELTDETYEAIILEAEKFNHDLTSQFGLLSYECEDEKEFIEKSKAHIQIMFTCTKSELMSLFYDNPPPKAAFHKALNKILLNISKLENSH